SARAAPRSGRARSARPTSGAAASRSGAGTASVGRRAELGLPRRVEPRADADREAVQPDEARGVPLVVHVVLPESGVGRLVQRVRALTPRHRNAALVELQPHTSLPAPLAR